MRHQWIDALKGLGIILVIAMHSSVYFIFPTISMMLTAGYMAMFFIVSGYTSKKENTILGITKKAKRLLIPYFFYGILINSFFAILGNIDFKEWIGIVYSRFSLYPLGTPNNIILFSIHTTSPLWFLTAMFVSYIWFYIYINLQQKKSRILCILIYVIATIIMSDVQYLFPWSFDTSFICAIFIITGYELSGQAIKAYRKDILYFLTLLAMLAMYIFIVKFNGTTNLSIRMYGNWGVFSIIFYYLLSVFITVLYGETFKILNNTTLVRFFAFTGKHSLRIMCIHMPLVTYTGRVFASCGAIGIMATFIVAFLLSLAISIMLEKLFCRYSCKCGLLKYL